MRSAHRFGPLLAAALLVATPACTQVRNPATGELQYTTMTPREEARIGREEHPKVLAEFGGAYENGRLQDYVARVGERVQRVSELADQRFTFTLLDSDMVNAFALPGGYVYVTRGLLALAEDEAELAGVLGHEVGHVTARHTAQRYDRAVASQVGVLGATVLGAVLGGDLGAQIAQQVAGTAALAYVQGFSREQEFEADQLGIRYLARAGYDPSAMATFLEALERESGLRRRLEGTRERVPDWLASHPRTKDRVRQAAAAAAGRDPGRRDREAFLAAIDGMTFGDSPAQGLVQGTVFVHPVLDFRFEAPEGFTLRNTPRAVFGRGPGGRALVFDFGEAQRTSDPSGYLQNEWVARQRLQGLQRFTTADGRAGALGFGRVVYRNEPAGALLAVIETGRPRQFYRFVLLREGRLDAADARAFRATVESFRGLTAAERAAARPLRIRIHTVAPGETVESLAQRMELPHGAEWFAVLNPQAARGLRPGDKVKLVVRG